MTSCVVRTAVVLSAKWLDCKQKNNNELLLVSETVTAAQKEQNVNDTADMVMYM
jgi:hypothetical protein